MQIGSGVRMVSWGEGDAWIEAVVYGEANERGQPDPSTAHVVIKRNQSRPRTGQEWRIVGDQMS